MFLLLAPVPSWRSSSWKRGAADQRNLAAAGQSLSQFKAIFRRFLHRQRVEVPISSSSANGAAADSVARIAMDAPSLGMAELSERWPGGLLGPPMEWRVRRMVKDWEQLEGHWRYLRPLGARDRRRVSKRGCA